MNIGKYMLATSENRKLAMRSYYDKLNTNGFAVGINTYNEDNSVSEYAQSQILNNCMMLISNAYKVVYGFKRVNYVANTTYDYLETTQDNSIRNNYVVLTNDNRVYVCLYNNDNKPSNIKPTHTTYNIKSYPDGYKWFYVYTLSANEITKQLTDHFVPFNYNSNSVQTFIYSHNEKPLKGQIYHVLGEHEKITRLTPVTFTGQNGAFNILGNKIDVTNSGTNYLVSDYLLDNNNKKIELLVTPKNGFHYNLHKLLNIHLVLINIELEMPMLGDEFVKTHDFDKLFIGNISLITKSIAKNEFHICKLPFLNSSSLANGVQAGDRIKIVHKTKNAINYGRIGVITSDGYMLIANNPLLQSVNSVDELELYVLDGETEVLIDFDSTKTIMKPNTLNDFKDLNDYEVIFSTNAGMTLDKDKKLTVNFMMDF